MPEQDPSSHDEKSGAAEVESQREDRPQGGEEQPVPGLELLSIDLSPDNYASAAAHDDAHSASKTNPTSDSNQQDRKQKKVQDSDDDDDDDDEEIINPRTHQSEAAYQQVRASYSAKVDDGNAYADLLEAVPALRAAKLESGNLDLSSARTGNGAGPTKSSHQQGDEFSFDDHHNGDGDGGARVRLDKRDTLRLGYAVAELYFAGQYEEVLKLCERVRARCDLSGPGDRKTVDAVERWEGKCLRRLEARRGSLRSDGNGAG